MTRPAAVLLRHLFILLPALWLTGCDDDSERGPAPAQRTLGGTVTGLTGSLELRNNGANLLSLSANGGFVFSLNVAEGHDYDVTIATQPVDQACTVSNGSGTAGTTNITSVLVQCTVNGSATTHAVGGTVSGLVGSLEIGNNLADPQVLMADGNFTFSAGINVGGHYQVSVITQPTGQTCSVANATGTIAGSDVTDVAVSCASNMYQLGGRVNGLLNGLAEPLQLQVSGGNDKALSSDGTFTFADPLPHGTNYTVAVVGKPVAQTCTVLNGSGTITAHTDNITINCAISTFTIGGTISGLDGSIALNNNLTATLIRITDGPFGFSSKLAYGSPYSVTISTQPAGQECTLANASGTATANVADIQVDCVNKTYPIRVIVEGISDSITLQNNGVDELELTADGSAYFATELAHGADWDITITAPPTGRACTLLGGSGTVVATEALAFIACIDTAPAIASFGLGTIVHPGELVLTWNTTVGAQWYQLYRSTDAGTTWAQVGGDLAEDPDNNAVTEFMPLHRQDWAKLRYRLVACNVFGCGPPSLTVNPTLRIPDLIGYFKSDNSDTGDGAGSSVALSADGNTLAVGAPCEDSNAASGVAGSANNALSCSGAVYVYHRSGNGDWTQAAYLKASQPDAGDRFGSVIALAADGQTLAISAPGEDSGGIGINGDEIDDSLPDAGAVYVFTRSADTWSKQAYLKASNTAGGDRFGSAIAIAADGNTLAASAAGEDSNAVGINADQANDLATEAGAVYVFTRDINNTWSQQAYVKASNTSQRDAFGFAVALSASGDTLAVGAPEEDSNATGIDNAQGDDAATAASGAAYLFTRDSNTSIWSQQAYVKASNTGRNDKFGSAVSLAATGSRLAVGAPGEDSDATGINGSEGNHATEGENFNAGAAYLFIRDSNTGIWSQQAYVKATNSDNNDQFGSALALSADGGTLAVSARDEAGSGTGLTADGDSDTATESGAVYVYQESLGNWSAGTYVKASNTAAGDHFGVAVALSSDGDLMAVGADGEDSAARNLTLSSDAARNDDSATESGAVYLY